MESKREIEAQQRILQLIRSFPKEKQKKILKEVLHEAENVPLSIFRTELSGLEALVVHLKNIKKQTVKEISKSLNRRTSTIYTTYRKAVKKFKKTDMDYSITVPLNVFSNRKFSILESLVFYLKHDKNLPLTEIAKLLDRKYNTIKTVYRRYRIKKNEK